MGFAAFALSVVAAGCSAGASAERAGSQSSAVIACVDPGAWVPPGSWVCGADRTAECEGPQGADAGVLVVVPIVLDDSGTTPSCSAVTLTPSSSVAGPLTLGDHTITVREDTASSSGVACTSTLHVVDTTPPVAAAQDIFLWPPNHEMHDVTIADCAKVSDVCDSAVSVSFTYVSSDEAPTVHGSGHTSPDVAVIDCRHVSVRSERAGGGDGRVYRIGYEAVDHSGNHTRGSCRVLVAHDQSGRAVGEGADAYRVPVDTTGCL